MRCGNKETGPARLSGEALFFCAVTLCSDMGRHQAVLSCYCPAPFCVVPNRWGAIFFRWCILLVRRCSRIWFSASSAW